MGVTISFETGGISLGLTNRGTGEWIVGRSGDCSVSQRLPSVPLAGGEFRLAGGPGKQARECQRVKVKPAVEDTHQGKRSGTS